jgi:hypothetical protein
MEVLHVSPVNMGPSHWPQAHAICIPVLSRKLAVFVFPVLPLKGRLFGLVVRVPGYRSRGPGFDYRRYKIF